MTANRGIWKLYHGSMPIVNTRIICQLWYMAVIPWLLLLHSLHSGQTVVYIVYTTGGAFDLYSSHSTTLYYLPIANPCCVYTVQCVAVMMLYTYLIVFSSPIKNVYLIICRMKGTS